MSSPAAATSFRPRAERAVGCERTRPAARLAVLPAAGVAELADAHGSGPCWLRLVWVQVPPPAPLSLANGDPSRLAALLVACVLVPGRSRRGRRVRGAPRALPSPHSGAGGRLAVRPACARPLFHKHGSFEPHQAARLAALLVACVRRVRGAPRALPSPHSGASGRLAVRPTGRQQLLPGGLDSAGRIEKRGGTRTPPCERPRAPSRL